MAGRPRRRARASGCSSAAELTVRGDRMGVPPPGRQSGRSGRGRIVSGRAGQRCRWSSWPTSRRRSRSCPAMCSSCAPPAAVGSALPADRQPDLVRRDVPRAGSPPRAPSATTGCCSDGGVEAGAPARAMIGVDVGGTFTDVVLADPDGRLHIGKVPTTPDDPRDGRGRRHRRGPRRRRRGSRHGDPAGARDHARHQRHPAGRRSAGGLRDDAGLRRPAPPRP